MKIQYKIKILDGGDPIDEKMLQEYGNEGYQLVARHVFNETEFDPDYRGGLGRDLHYPKVQLVFSRPALVF